MLSRYLHRLYDTVISRGYIEIEYNIPVPPWNRLKPQISVKFFGKLKRCFLLKTRGI